MKRLVGSDVLTRFKQQQLLERQRLGDSLTAPTGRASAQVSSSSSASASGNTPSQYMGRSKIIDIDQDGQIRFFPTWTEDERMSKLDHLFEILQEHLNTKLILHANTRLGDEREGLLVDCGAISNLSGEQQIQRMAEIAKKQTGMPTTIRPLSRGLRVEGVGNGVQEAVNEAVVPICLADGSLGHYAAPFIPGSPIPSLYGLHSMHAQRTVIDIVNKRLIWVGPGGYQMTLSPGSKILALESAPSGHLLLPVTEWKKAVSTDGLRGKDIALTCSMAGIEMEPDTAPPVSSL